MIKAVVFDMDGTIADSEKIAERVTREFFQKRGIVMTREEEKAMFGLNWKDLVKEILESRGFEYNQNIKNTLKERYVRTMSRDVKALPGVYDLLAEVSKSLKVGLATNSRHREALDEYFVALEYASSSGNQVSSGSYDIQIFSKIPKDTLLEYAVGISSGGKYADALNIFSYLLRSYPEMSPSINPYYAICKIAIISKTSYEKLPEIGGPFKIKNPGNFVLSLSNKSEKELIFYFSSSGGSVFILQAKGRLDVTLPMGSCEIAVEASDNTPPVYYGQLNFEENKKYSMTFLKAADNTSTTK